MVYTTYDGTAISTPGSTSASATPVWCDETLHPIVRAKCFIDARHVLRRNRLTGRLEMASRPVGGSGPLLFEPLDVSGKRTLMLELAEAGLPTLSMAQLDAAIDNRRVEAYDPIAAYLDALPVWDGTDRIDALFVLFTDDDFELSVLHRAFVATVAQMSGRGLHYGNELCPVLVSRQQGWGKSKFLRHLLPPELDAFFTDTFPLSREEECLRRMASYALICLDEFDHYGGRRMALLKNLIQLKDIRLRASYHSWMECRPRLASFWGTSNRRYLLNDPTGSRRFFPVMLRRSIPVDVAIDHAQLYAQALAELQDRKKRVWFTQKENERIERHNSPFCADKALKRMLDNRFERLALSGRYCSDAKAQQLSLMTASDVYAVVNALDPELAACYTEQNFGSQLKALGYSQLSGRSLRYYNMRLRKTDDDGPSAELLSSHAE